MQRLTNTRWKQLGLGLFGFVVFCCVAIIMIGVLNPKPTTTASAPTAVAVQAPTYQAISSAPTYAPIVAARVPPTDAPTGAPEPTEEPTNTPEPTAALACPPAPIAEAPAAPQPAASTDGGPTFTGKTVDPAWWPCKEGQVKANQNSGIFHVPGGRDYAKTYKNVQCFDTVAAAAAAGYRQAQR